MLLYILLTILTCILIEIFLRIEIIKKINRLFAIYKKIFKVLRSKKISDDSKMRALPKYNIRSINILMKILLHFSVIIFVGYIGIMAIEYVVFSIFEQSSDKTDSQNIWQELSSYKIMLILTVVSILYYMVRNRFIKNY